MALSKLETAINEASKNPLNRDRLCGYLQRVLDLGDSKLDRRGVAQGNQLGWARVMVSAVVAGTVLERDKDLDSLREDVETLKKTVEEQRQRGGV